MMLQRVANLIMGAMIAALSGYMLLLHLTSGEPADVPILLLGGTLLMGAAACFRVGLAAGAGGLARPSSPGAGGAAAQRLLALKKSNTGSRWRGFGRVRRFAEAPPPA